MSSNVLICWWHEADSGTSRDSNVMSRETVLALATAIELGNLVTSKKLIHSVKHSRMMPSIL